MALVVPETGKLAHVANCTTEAQPRGIKIDQSTGKLSEPNRHPVGNGANWVEIVDLQ